MIVYLIQSKKPISVRSVRSALRSSSDICDCGGLGGPTSNLDNDMVYLRVAGPESFSVGTEDDNCNN